MSSPSNRRRNYFSNPRVQAKIVGVFAFLAITYAATNFYVSIYNLNSIATHLEQLPLSEINRHDVSILISQQRVALEVQIAVLTLLSWTMLLLGGAFISHKIGGPIYRITSYMQRFSEGKTHPQRIKFRRMDFFHELASTFNDFQEKAGIIPAEETTGDPESEA